VEEAEYRIYGLILIPRYADACRGDPGLIRVAADY
jgi:hypothetical protein